jgi:2-(1,2-epoxy-1,2-dihydrophenyl)acetyl-CoA isomerase
MNPVTPANPMTHPTATTLTVENGIARLRFTSPENGNPINRRYCDELCDQAIELSCRDDVRVVLVTAEGRNFGFGGDIAHFVAQGDRLPSEIKRMTATIHSAVARLQRMDAPMVVAVQGVCAGGSAAFAAGCDVVVSADNARWVAAYTGIGYSTDASATVMFSRRMGLARARNFLLRNQTLDAQAALAAGLADEVVPADQLLAHAEQIAQQFAAGPTRAYGEVRRLLLSVQDQPLETQLELESQALARIARTADAREGLQAFSEKRKPRFSGR